MELPFTSADRMGEFAIGLGRSIYGESAFEQLEKSGLTVIGVSVLRRLLLMAGFTTEEIAAAQETGTTRALTNKLMSPPPVRPLTSKQGLLDWLLNGAVSFAKGDQLPPSHQPGLAFACVRNGGTELDERFWEQLKAQAADPDVKK